jgi:hypothetical protein
VAISNNRLIDFVDGRVAFAWKDYRHESRRKVMCLEAQEFVRRFLLHVLPTGFQRIRHYGLLANRYREIKLDHCRQLLAAPAPVVELPDAVLDYRDRYQRLTGVARWCASNPSCRAPCPGGHRPRHHERDLEPSVPALLAASRTAAGLPLRVRANDR